MKNSRKQRRLSIFATNSKVIALKEGIEATDIFGLIYGHVVNKKE